MTPNTTQFGFVAIVGRPNVGKSTLMNALLDKKISITSRKPQTTRQRILGIKTTDHIQIAYVDTPGLHAKPQYASHRHLNRAAQTALAEVDMIVFVVDVKAWQTEDDWILKQLQQTTHPIILVLNKIDRLNTPDQLLPIIAACQARADFQTIIPISAKKRQQLDRLEDCIMSALPEGEYGYSPDQWTDRSDRFMAMEILREKLFRYLGEELPYTVHITIDAFEESDRIIKIAAIIWIDKISQKAILIGKGGSRLKTIGTQARLDMEAYFEKKVFIDTWVKIKSKNQDRIPTDDQP